MKTWRERIVEARERGRFTVEDRCAWRNLTTCPAGEVAARYGKTPEGPWLDLWYLGNDMDALMLASDFAGAEGLLERIEDMALEFKRSEIA